MGCSQRDLAARLRTSGLDIPEQAIWTSALAIARFLQDQRPDSFERITRAIRLIDSIADLLEELD